jgi:hypothetical protein
MANTLRLMLMSLLLVAPAASAQQPTPINQTDVDAVQTFINSSSAPCQTQPAQTCIDAAWRFAAASPKQGLSVQDAQTLRQRLGNWYAVRQGALQPQERGSIGFGLLMADSLGIPRVHAAFDTNHDGRVSQQELLADVKVDKRPLGEIMKDPNAVDRPGIARRLGLPPALIEGLFQP